MSNATEYFVSQWGWEQTNVTFYKVIKKTAKTVTVIEVGSKREYTQWGQYVAVPTDESPRWAKVMRKKVKNFSRDLSPWHDQIDVTSFSCAYRWDGQAVEGTCYA